MTVCAVMVNFNGILGRLAAAFAVACVALSAGSCSKSHFDTDDNPAPSNKRVVSDVRKKVLIIYSAGMNNLYDYLDGDLDDVSGSFIPRDMSSADVLLVYSRRPVRGSYVANPSHLYRISRDINDNVVRDTVMSFPGDSSSCSVNTLNAVLSYAKDTYPTATYGMIFSSHATGWIPSEYSQKQLTTSSVSANSYNGDAGSEDGSRTDAAGVLDGHSVSISSVGIDMTAANTPAYDFDIEDFAAAIPMKMDYIVFDACLMGGIETAYALKDKVNYLVASQTETMADGLCDYNLITKKLLGYGVADLYGMCEDSYAHYAALSGMERSLTISMVDCTKLDSLAEVCKDLFSRYRTEIANVNPDAVQAYFHRYFTSSARRHYYYDLADILRQSGVLDADMDKLDNVIENCIVYKAATPQFLTLTIRTHCGLSMYLPANGSELLDKFYKTLSWNKATGLVQ